jgi:hypothetical protein
MNLKEKEVFYRRHYENFLKSNQNKVAYCKEHLISLSAFKNWFYKFEIQKNNIIAPVGHNSKVHIQKQNQLNTNFAEVREFSNPGLSLYKINIGKVVIELPQLPNPQWVYELIKLAGEVA